MTAVTMDGDDPFSHYRHGVTLSLATTTPTTRVWITLSAYLSKEAFLSAISFRPAVLFELLCPLRLSQWHEEFCFPTLE
jgi:hypothetical protein